MRLCQVNLSVLDVEMLKISSNRPFPVLEFEIQFGIEARLYKHLLSLIDNRHGVIHVIMRKRWQVIKGHFDTSSETPA
jgi:hypothetical protein